MSDILDPHKHTKPFQFFLRVNRKELWLLLLNAVLYGLGNGTLIAVSYCLGKLIDALNSNVPVSSFLYELIGLLILCEICYRVGHVCEVFISSRIRAHTKKALFDHSRSLSFGYFADRFSGEIAHKISMCANAFEGITSIIINSLTEKTIFILISLIVLGSMHYYYVIFLSLWSFFLLYGLVFLARNMNKKAAAWSLQDARTTGTLVDVYTNIATVKVYGHEDNKQSVYNQIDREIQAFRRFGTWNILMYAFTGITVILFAVVLITLTASLYEQNIVTTGAIVTISTIAFHLYFSVWELGPQLTECVRFWGEVQQNLDDLIVTPTIVDTDHPVHQASKRTSVEYHHVSFGYNAKHPILNNFTFVIKANEKVGIVGLSGSGKTTFANLLLRFFDVQKGKILLNNVDIKNYTQEFLRSQISYVSQDTALFHASIAENIAYGASAASLEDVKQAAKLAYADEFIKKLPDGYESVVGERGVKLSGGQRQRIAIARALLSNRPLFLFDEATSALDSDSEQKIQKGLTTLMKDKTVIAIAHRLSTLAHMDRIIFLANGEIVEAGTHSELLDLNGQYAKLWQMQARGFLPTDIS